MIEPGRDAAEREVRGHSCGYRYRDTVLSNSELRRFIRAPAIRITVRSDGTGMTATGADLRKRNVGLYHRGGCIYFGEFVRS
jgi:hypothetical protein